MSSAVQSQPDPYIVDAGRLEALADSGLLGEDIDPALARWTRLSSSLIGAPIALLSMVDEDRQYFKSHVGLGAELAAARETPLSHSFCQHVVATQQPLVVDDARGHPVVGDNAAAWDHQLLAYAGQPITSGGHTLGSFCVIDTVPRVWTESELVLLEDLAAGLSAEIEMRAALRSAAALQDELAHQALADALTGLPNRRQLAEDLSLALAGHGPQVLAVFDLDGFKSYNDAFGHPAGDALLMRLASNLASVAADSGGMAYRLGGDEFCVLAPDEPTVARAVEALCEHGDGFSIGTSHGLLHLGQDGLSPERAMIAADERMYVQKRRRSDSARKQAHDVLMSVLHESEPELDAHVRGVATLARRVGVHLGLGQHDLDEVALAAQLHDIGKVAIPDSVLEKPEPLDEDEWALMRQHTLLGERILSAAPALHAVASLVRSSHERWDGGGYPDGLLGEDIPVGARIVLACDAYNAMTSKRVYSPQRASDAAVDELRRHAGTQFDPTVVAALTRVLEEDRPTR